jgi:hypothetical protein
LLCDKAISSFARSTSASAFGSECIQTFRRRSDSPSSAPYVRSFNAVISARVVAFSVRM